MIKVLALCCGVLFTNIEISEWLLPDPIHGLLSSNKCGAEAGFAHSWPHLVCRVGVFIPNFYVENDITLFASGSLRLVVIQEYLHLKTVPFGQKITLTSNMFLHIKNRHLASWEQSVAETKPNVEGWRHPHVLDVGLDYQAILHKPFWCVTIDKFTRGTMCHGNPRAVGFDSKTGRFSPSKRSAIGHTYFEQIPKKQERANPNEYCGVERIIPHVLRGRIHGLCGRIHALLGGKVSYLPLAGFAFAALSGIGLGLVFDQFDRDRKRKPVGLLLLIPCLPLGVLCLLLGLP